MTWRPAWCWRKRGVRSTRGRPEASAPSEEAGLPEGDAAHQAELSVVPAVLAELPLAGRVVTGDALYCQHSICALVRQAHGHYLFVVKANQPALLEALVLLFERPPVGEHFGRAQSSGLHGDRYETRSLLVSTALNAYLRGELGWHGVGQVLRLERCCTQRGMTTREVRYLITSLPARVSPGHLLRWIRAHWWIENKLHYVRDVTMGEDGSQIRSGVAPQVMAALRSTAIAVLRLNGWTNIAAGLREGAWCPGAVLRFLGLPVG